MNKDNLSYIIHHMNEDDNPYGAVSPPIYQSSIFSFKSFSEFKETLTDQTEKTLYTRGNNPTVVLAEQKLAALEGAEKAKLLSSGTSAITHAIMAFLKSGDHVVCVRDCYDWCSTLLEKYLARFGVTHSYADGTDINDVIGAIRNETKVIYLESPTSFTFKLQDLPAIAAEAKKRGIKTVADNTWATPVYCNPHKLGIDIVVHSGSKYFGGSSDILSGLVAGTKEDINLIKKQEFMQFGTVPDPFMAWLLLRGLRTLHIRLKTHYENAMTVASFLEKHPRIERVIYPMLPSHPQHDLAKKIFRGGSGLLGFNLKTGKYSSVVNFVNALKLFKRAISWGGYESLVYPLALKYNESDDVPREKLSLVRIHVGLEQSEDLIEDLDNALREVND